MSHYLWDLLISMWSESSKFYVMWFHFIIWSVIDFFKFIFLKVFLKILCSIDFLKCGLILFFSPLFVEYLAQWLAPESWHKIINIINIFNNISIINNVLRFYWAYNYIVNNRLFKKCLHIPGYMERDRKIYSCVLIFQLIKEQIRKGLWICLFLLSQQTYKKQIVKSMIYSCAPKMSRSN